MSAPVLAASTPAQVLARREPIIANGVLGMLIFVFTEIMLFAGLVSAFVIAKADAGPAWPPPYQPRLPAGETAINTLALLASGALLMLVLRAHKAAPEGKKTRRLLLASILLGAFFVAFQGMEWVGLLGQGLTLTTSVHSSFFYMIVGTHGVHAVAAILSMSWVYRQLQRGEMTRTMLSTAAVFWFFVVGIWPVLYTLVYL